MVTEGTDCCRYLQITSQPTPVTHNNQAIKWSQAVLLPLSAALRAVSHWCSVCWLKTLCLRSHCTFLCSRHLCLSLYPPPRLCLVAQFSSGSWEITSAFWTKAQMCFYVLKLGYCCCNLLSGQLQKCLKTYDSLRPSVVSKLILLRWKLKTWIVYIFHWYINVTIFLFIFKTLTFFFGLV